MSQNQVKAPAIQTGGKPCRFCSRTIPDSIAHLYGSSSEGYTCPECLFKEQLDITQASKEITELRINSPLASAPCAMCGKPIDDFGRMVQIENRWGLIHSSCYGEYMKKNREKIGPRAQFLRKLR